MLFSFIEKVVYINLDHRTDRKNEVEKELAQHFPQNKIIRFPAIKHEIGAIGCSASHIEVLKMAIDQNWKNVLVVEDDAMWNQFNKGSRLLKTIVNDNPSFDVILLGSTIPRFNPRTYQLFSGQTTTAYLVQNHYYHTLLENFLASFEEFQKKMLDNNAQYDMIYRECAIDQYWKKLQVRHHWYVVVPSLMIQRASYSDIDRDFRDNRKWFA